mmetsp:Transcript_32073/g.96496  ORF Transcript_32073/g.96496 Transcript_32073/m.96496 type:complete len:230 (-) Transcript_32073:445-1134(-)
MADVEWGVRGDSVADDVAHLVVEIIHRRSERLRLPYGLDDVARARAPLEMMPLGSEAGQRRVFREHRDDSLVRLAVSFVERGELRILAGPGLQRSFPRQVRREKFVHGARVVRVLGVVSFEQHDLGHGVVSRLRGEVMLQFATDVERHLLGRRHGRDHDEASHRLATAPIGLDPDPGSVRRSRVRRGIVGPLFSPPHPGNHSPSAGTAEKLGRTHLCNGSCCSHEEARR